MTLDGRVALVTGVGRRIATITEAAEAFARDRIIGGV